MIFDHVAISVSDPIKSKEFFTKALAPLGISIVMENGGWVGMGKSGKPQFWFGKGDNVQNPMHLAFSAETRSEVDKFYDAAILAGGTDNGKPGVREHYTPTYYASFVIGPDGHNIEAVCHK